MSHVTPHARSPLVKASENVVKCGLCGGVISYPTPFGSPILSPAIQQAYGSAARAHVSLTLGEDDSDVKAGETTSFDICPRCFEEKLQPWLEQQGAEAHVEPWCL